jgi:hypothetical protein
MSCTTPDCHRPTQPGRNLCARCRGKGYGAGLARWHEICKRERNISNTNDIKLEPLFYVRRGEDGIEFAVILDGQEYVRPLTRGAAWHHAQTVLNLLRELET